MHDLISQWRLPLLSKLKQAMGTDAAHDLAHIERVTHTAMRLGEAEQANLEVIIQQLYCTTVFMLTKNRL